MARRLLLLPALALALSACTSSAPSVGEAGTDGAEGGATSAGSSDAASDDADGPTCADGFFWEADGCTTPASIDLGEVRSGGPPPDGIPPIDEPVLEDVAAADEWLSDTSPVIELDAFLDGALELDAPCGYLVGSAAIDDLDVLASGEPLRHAARVHRHVPRRR